jgi:hypothetical protein
VEFRAVTLVLAEAILRETRAEVAHNRISRHLRDYARGRDAQAVAITVDDRRLRQRKWENRQAVDKDVLRLSDESRDCDSHCLMARSQNVDRVDLDRIDNADGPRDSIVRDKIVVNRFAFLGQQLLRVVQLPVLEFLWKNYRGGDNGPGERATAGLIDPGDR